MIMCRRISYHLIFSLPFLEMDKDHLHSHHLRHNTQNRKSPTTISKLSNSNNAHLPKRHAQLQCANPSTSSLPTTSSADAPPQHANRRTQARPNSHPARSNPSPNPAGEAQTAQVNYGSVHAGPDGLDGIRDRRVGNGGLDADSGGGGGGYAALYSVYGVERVSVWDQVAGSFDFWGLGLLVLG